MPTFSQRRLEPLQGILNGLRDLPLTGKEVKRLWRDLEEQEARVAALGREAAVERADVDWVERPLVKLGLALVGQLKDRRDKEHGEYHAAMAKTMQAGEVAARLRDYLTELPKLYGLRDDQVYLALAPVQITDLGALDLDVSVLHERAQRAVAFRSLATVCGVVAREVGRGSKAHVWTSGRRRIRKRLRQLERADLLERLRLESDPDVLRAIQSTLLQEADVLVEGLASALRNLVRDHLTQEHPWI